MSFFKKSNIADVIRCDEPSYLIWKWRPEGKPLGESKRENAIRWGSSLRVKEGEIAVFVYRQSGEVMQEIIRGPFDETLKTANLPMLVSILGLAYGGASPFQAEVYFINLARVIQVKFGVPFFDVFDPRYLDFGVPVAVRGTISFRIEDYKGFIQQHRLIDFDLDDFQREIRDVVARYIKSIVANAPTEFNIPVIQLERKVSEINELLEMKLHLRLANDFRVKLSAVDISAIDVDKASEGYRRLIAVTRDVTDATVRAQSAVNIKDMQDKQRIDAGDYAETLRIKREETQYAQRKQTQSANFAAYQTEVQAEVGVAGAEAVGQNIAGVMNSAMSGWNQQAPTNNLTSPPVPSVMYHVVVNGQATGPYDLDTLKQMASVGRLTKDSLVWKPGMSQWEKAEGECVLNLLFGDVPAGVQ